VASVLVCAGPMRPLVVASRNETLRMISKIVP
jgi:hypothetical protein